MKPIDIRWISRYSDTDKPDKNGRWARVAYAGKFEDSKMLDTKTIDRWEIAWVKKVPQTSQVFAQYLFPSHGKNMFDTLEEAKKEVEKQFNYFIKTVIE